jgi:hypothetical protein
VSQLIINMTPELASALKRLKRARRIKTNAEAIRLAVKEALERKRPSAAVDFTEWVGLGISAPPSVRPRFHGDDDLWGER